MTEKGRGYLAKLTKTNYGVYSQTLRPSTTTIFQGCRGKYLSSQGCALFMAHKLRKSTSGFVGTFMKTIAQCTVSLLSRSIFWVM